MRSISPYYKNDPESRNQFILKYLPYVKRIVNRIAVHLPAHVDQEDLINAGVIGLISAAERFDPSKENSFITYAAFRVRGAVLSELRSRDYISRQARKKIRRMDQTFRALEQRLGREPEDAEIASEMGIDLDELFNIKKMAGISFVSFEELGYSSREEKKRVLKYLVNHELPDAFAKTRLKELSEHIAVSMEKLNEKEKLVISLYYWDEMTMKEIGKVLGITESRVSQIHAKAILRLRNWMKRRKALDD